MKLYSRIAIFVLSLGLALGALAEDYILFEQHGVPVDAYNPILQQLQPGDRIRFSDGKWFTISRLLDADGRGATSFILLIKEGGVLRIPKGSGFHQDTLFIDWLDSYAQGYSYLRDSDIQTVAVDLPGSRRWEYIRQDYLEHSFTLDDLFRGKVAFPGSPFNAPESQVVARISAEEGKRALEKAADFLASTWKFDDIGDFKADQVPWVKDDWILMDWHMGHNFATELERRSYSARNINEVIGDLPESYRSQVETRIRVARAENPDTLSRGRLRNQQIYDLYSNWNSDRWRLQIQLLERFQAERLLRDLPRRWGAEFWEFVPKILKEDRFSTAAKGEILTQLNEKLDWPLPLWRELIDLGLRDRTLGRKVRALLRLRSTWPPEAHEHFSQILRTQRPTLHPSVLSEADDLFQLATSRLPNCLDTEFGGLTQ